jgi:hypothetical protein
MKAFFLLFMICLTVLLIASEKYWCELARAQVDMERVQVERDRIRAQILRGVRPPPGLDESYQPDPERSGKGL